MLDGLITFFASHHAIRADKVLRAAGYKVKLIPGPKELSPNCGVALRFEYAVRSTVLGVLDDKHVRIDEVHAYSPSTDDRSAPHGARRSVGSWLRTRP